MVDMTTTTLLKPDCASEGEPRLGTKVRAMAGVRPDRSSAVPDVSTCASVGPLATSAAARG
jgi:hypothetical protein